MSRVNLGKSAESMTQETRLAQDAGSLLELWQEAQRRWRHVAAWAIAGLAAGGLAIWLIPPKYEAIAVAQVGQIGQVGQLASAPVEPAIQAVERMRTPAFQLRVAERIGHEEWLADLKRSPKALADAEHLVLNLAKSTSAMGNSALIEVRAKAETADSARRIVDAAIHELASKHAEMAKPTLDRMHLDLAIARERLASAEKELTQVGRAVANVGVKDDRFTQLSLMTALRVQKESELFNQRQAIMALQTALEAPASVGAKAIEGTFAWEKAVSPKRGLLLTVGLVGGTLAGLISVFAGLVRRRRSA